MNLNILINVEGIYFEESERHKVIIKKQNQCEFHREEFGC
jgi:hypothetical protein